MNQFINNDNSPVQTGASCYVADGSLQTLFDRKRITKVHFVTILPIDFSDKLSLTKIFYGACRRKKREVCEDIGAGSV
jgi:hypothetical protein